MSATKNRVGRPKSGQTLVEFALVLPILLILIMNVVNFGGFFFAWITVQNAARSGMLYGIAGQRTVGQPDNPGRIGGVRPSIQSVVQTDTSGSLRIPGNVVIRVCYRSPSSSPDAIQWGDNGYTSSVPCPSTFSNPPPDTSAEAALYDMAWLDVSYKYVPPVAPGFGFPGLGLYATLPNNLVIHRQVVMRLMR